MVKFLRQCRMERSLAAEKVASGEGSPGLVWRVPLPRLQDALKGEALLNTMRHFGLDRFISDGFICGTSEGASSANTGIAEKRAKELSHGKNDDRFQDVANKSTISASSAPKSSNVRGNSPSHRNGAVAGKRQPSPPRQAAGPKR